MRRRVRKRNPADAAKDEGLRAFLNYAREELRSTCVADVFSDDANAVAALNLEFICGQKASVAEVYIDVP
jgi:hypothetical protein